MKHGNRRSAFQLISSDGAMTSSSLLLEREEEDTEEKTTHLSDSGSNEPGKGSGIGVANLYEALAGSSNTFKKRDKKKDKKVKKEKDDRKIKEKDKAGNKKEGVRIRQSNTDTDPLVEVIGKAFLLICANESAPADLILDR